MLRSLVGSEMCIRDSTQVYLSVPVDAASSATAPFSHCIADVATWFSVNRLHLNPAKTQIIWLRSKRQVEKVNILDVPIMATSVQTVDSARDLGVVVDSHLTMTTQMSAVCRAAYYQLRQLRPLYARCRLMPPSCYSKRSFQHALTIATQYCPESETTCTHAYKPFKMPQHASSPTREGASTSRPSCSSYIGFQ